MDARKQFADSLEGMVPGLPKLAAKEPVPGSSAASDLEKYPDVFVGTTAVVQLQVEAAAEHVIAIARLFRTAPLLQFPLYNCIRSMLEPCAVVIWLTSPDVDQQERIRRTMAIRLKAAIEYQKCAKASGAPFEDRKGAIRSAALKVGAKNLEMPGATRMIAENLGSEHDPVYRLLSGAAHGQHWAIRQLGFTEDSRTGIAATFRKVPDPKSLTTFSFGAAEAFAKAWTSWAAYLGHDPGIEELFAKVGQHFANVIEAES